MGKKIVNYSDLSGRLFELEDDVVQLVVVEHPDLAGGPVTLEAFAEEVALALEAAHDAVMVEVLMPGEVEPRRVVLDAATFDKLATDQPMKTLLENAATKPAKRSSTQRVNFASIEHAGTPHRGKVTAEEAEIVRTHLDEVNERLAAAGLRQIDPTNPEHVARYGLLAPRA